MDRPGSRALAELKAEIAARREDAEALKRRQLERARAQATVRKRRWRTDPANAALERTRRTAPLPSELPLAAARNRLKRPAH